MRRTVIVFAVVAVFLSSAPVADADVIVPPKARYRPSVGWVCWPSRVFADLDGDGRRDRALYWFKPDRHGLCDDSDFRPNFRITVFFGAGTRIQQFVPCFSSPVIHCGIEAADLDRDRRSELLVWTTGGLQGRSYEVFRVARGGFLRLTVFPPGSRAFPPGPLEIGSWTNLAYRVGYGCRTHPGGNRVLVAWNGDLAREGVWRYVRARLRLDGDGFRVLGTRTWRAPSRPDPLAPWPHEPKVRPCLRSI